MATTREPPLKAISSQNYNLRAEKMTRVAELVQSYEVITITASPPQTPPDTSSSDREFVRRESYILDFVPEDPSDAEDYMIPYASPVASPDGDPSSPRLPRHRRSLPRMNTTLPTIVVPDEDTPMPDAWTGEVSPKTIPAWPTPAELHAEQERLRQLTLHERPKSTHRGNARRMINKSAKYVRKLAGKGRIHLKRNSSTRADSQDTFELRTPKRKLETQPSVKSRAKRFARGAMHSLQHLPENSVEVTAQTAKTLRKSASQTSMRVASRVDDAKEKVSTTMSAVRPPRSRYYQLADDATGSINSDAKPLIQNTHATPGSQPWSAPAGMDEPWTGIIPPPPTPMRPRPRNRLRKQNPAPITQIPATYSQGEHVETGPRLKSKTPSDAVFAQALVSDIEWQAQDAMYPMIIVTGNDNDQGSWYLPLNSAGQIEIQYEGASQSAPTPSSSPRSSMDSTASSVDSTASGRFGNTRKWYNGRLSFGSTRSVSANVRELRGSDDRRVEHLLAGYDDQTPLLVEFFDDDERAKRASARASTQPKAMIWAPIGSIVL